MTNHEQPGELPDYGAVPPPQPGQLPNYGSVPPPPPGGYPGYWQGPRQNQMALWSMILGITGVVLALCCQIGGILGIPAIILGIIGRSEITRANGTQTGGGMAIAGIVTGAVSVLLAVSIFVLLAVVGLDGSFTVG